MGQSVNESSHAQHHWSNRLVGPRSKMGDELVDIGDGDSGEVENVKMSWCLHIYVCIQNTDLNY